LPLFISPWVYFVKMIKIDVYYDFELLL